LHTNIVTINSIPKSKAMAPAAATTSPTTPTTTNKGRILIVGGTGFIGKFVTEASLSTTHPTYLLVRPGPLLSSKAATIKAFQEKGAIVIYVSRSQYIIYFFCLSNYYYF
jgi:hypothetical protein